MYLPLQPPVKFHYHVMITSCLALGNCSLEMVNELLYRTCEVDNISQLVHLVSGHEHLNTINREAVLLCSNINMQGICECHFLFSLKTTR